MSTGEIRCNGVIRALFDEARERKLSIRDIEMDAGLGSGVMYCWRTRKEPLLGNVIAALNVMGLDLAVVPRKKDV
jgi:hypothetical protein